MRASLEPVDPVARWGRGATGIVQKHFHAFHAFIHPAWPDGCLATPFFFTGSGVAGEPG